MGIGEQKDASLPSLDVTLPSVLRACDTFGHVAVNFQSLVSRDLSLLVWKQQISADKADDLGHLGPRTSEQTEFSRPAYPSQVLPT
jgi:hypothetical protein